MSDDKHHFVGQVIDHISLNMIVVWDLDGGGSYRAVRAGPTDQFPIGSVVDCSMSDPTGFVDQMSKATDEAANDRRAKLLIAPK